MEISKPIIVIYHRADFDGLFSREIAKRFFGDNAEYIGWDYGDAVPEVKGAETVYMIDISVDALMGHPGLVWIDHHKSAIEKFPARIRGYRIDGVAACRLAWQWFNHPDGPCSPYAQPSEYWLPLKQAYLDRLVSEPCAVQLAGEYDVWDRRNPDAELFQHGLRTAEINWSMLLGCDRPAASAYICQLLSAGEVLQFARRNENKSVITQQGFTVDFEGLTFLACNSARFNSHLFTAGLKPEHDGCLGFAWDGGKGKWKVSLYGVPGKPLFDFAAIAVKHGGGGHKQACGFECETLPFRLAPTNRVTELAHAALNLCYAIEALPASEEQTALAVMAGDISQKLSSRGL